MPGKADELENESNWDFDSAERREAIPNRRTVVSVAIPREEFGAISDAARQADMKVSEFIRVAAIEKARSEARWMVALSVTISMSDTAKLETMSFSGRTQMGDEMPTTFVSSPQPQPILLPV